MARAILKDLSSQLIAEPIISIQEAVIIGRSSRSQLRYSAALLIVSSQHARLFPVDIGWAIEDLGSCNGTFVNGKLITGPVLLKPNSKITIGRGGPELLFTVETIEQPKMVSSLPYVSGKTSHLSHTVLFPFFSVHKDVLRGGYLLPVSVTAICGALIALANHTQNVSLAQLTFSCLNCTLTCLGFYELCNQRKSLKFTLLIMFMMAIAAYGLISLHRSTCGAEGQGMWCNGAFISIIGEEFLTSIPILICLFLAKQFSQLWHRRMRIEDPLDGILIAGASATGLSLGQAISDSLGMAKFNLYLFSILLGLGPIAYSSLLGYCAGLFTLYARTLTQRWQKFALLLYGYTGAFGLKAVNYGIDSLPESGMWILFKMGLTVGYSLVCAYILYAYIIKAKNLSERLK